MCSPVAMCAVVVSKTSCKDRNHRILRGVIAPHQDYFFLQKSWFFSIFNQFFHGCCGETYASGRPEAPNSYSLTSWPELIVVTHGEYIPPGRAALTSWRSWPPEPPKHQYLLTGPIPQRSDLSHLHPLDEDTRQPRGHSHRSQNAQPCTPRTCGCPTWTSSLRSCCFPEPCRTSAVRSVQDAPASPPAVTKAREPARIPTCLV